ncbi:hypothetical protein F4808DRAFT_438687 [Astrocystis sublimbata]|nr:hypothetical protein F4808DRAFT_438687 [Astrocystis sublimbata]
MNMDDIDVSQLEGGLYANDGHVLIAWASLFIILCTLFVVLRFISLRIGRRSPGLEDWLILPAWILQIGLCANAICSVKYGGVGRHEAYILKYEPAAFPRWAQTLFATELLYGLEFPIVKTTILLLYLRLFRIHRWFRLTTYVLIAYIWLWGISELTTTSVQCTPVAYQWDKTIDGRCIDQLTYYRWISVPNVIHDVAMLILPLPMVWNLQIELRQKLALSAVFLIGSIGCIASFVRLSIFFKLNALSDNTWTSVPLHSWTLAEPGVILISACLPALWPLVLLAISRTSTLRSGSSKRLSDRETFDSRPAEAWRSSRAGFRHAGNDFVPLEDVEDGAGVGAATRYKVEGARAQTLDAGYQGQARNGISVMKEFSWRISGEADTPQRKEGA